MTNKNLIKQTIPAIKDSLNWPSYSPQSATKYWAYFGWGFKWERKWSKYSWSKSSTSTISLSSWHAHGIKKKINKKDRIFIKTSSPKKKKRYNILNMCSLSAVKQLSITRAFIDCNNIFDMHSINLKYEFDVWHAFKN